jgi:hypothetical protein
LEHFVNMASRNLSMLPVYGLNVSNGEEKDSCIECFKRSYNKSMVHGRRTSRHL